jgi:hypothetical protein
MASGVLVITHISKDLCHLLPDKELFMVSSKEDFKEKLEMILTDRGL